MDERLQKQLAFALEIDKEKDVLRQTHTTSKKQENDAEHAWHMAIMVWLLREYANEPFDVGKAMLMSLLHDVVEIDAGDTYAYDTVAMQTQAQREEEAAERIFGILPDEQKKECIALFHEFEEGITPEAKFARAIDNVQPLILNDYNNGGDWRKHKVTKSKIRKRNERTKIGSQTLWEHVTALIQKNVEKGNIIDE
ncbi:MAG: HD domain-containing protein [Clostridia bacterium]|nr:HD domain-containing protein [Clostridia bacterium]